LEFWGGGGGIYADSENFVFWPYFGGGIHAALGA
jgi:hypothetical protein